MLSVVTRQVVEGECVFCLTMSSGPTGVAALEHLL